MADIFGYAGVHGLSCCSHSYVLGIIQGKNQTHKTNEGNAEIEGGRIGQRNRQKVRITSASQKLRKKFEKIIMLNVS